MCLDNVSNHENCNCNGVKYKENIKYIFLTDKYLIQLFRLRNNLVDSHMHKQIKVLILNQKLVLNSSDKYTFKCKIYI